MSFTSVFMARSHTNCLSTGLIESSYSIRLQLSHYKFMVIHFVQSRKSKQ